MTKTTKEIIKLREIHSDLRIASMDYSKLSDSASMDLSVLKDIHNAISKVEHEIALREA
jgi:hypothetical protein